MSATKSNGTTKRNLGIYTVVRTEVRGVVTFNAYASGATYFGPYSTTLTIDGALHGRVGTHALTPSIDAMPVGDERYQAVRAYHDAEYRRAYDLIVEAYPEAAHGSRDMGTITTLSSR